MREHRRPRRGHRPRHGGKRIGTELGRPRRAVRKRVRSPEAGEPRAADTRRGVGDLHSVRLTASWASGLKSRRTVAQAGSVAKGGANPSPGPPRRTGQGVSREGESEGLAAKLRPVIEGEVETERGQVEARAGGLAAGRSPEAASRRGSDRRAYVCPHLMPRHFMPTQRRASACPCPWCVWRQMAAGLKQD